MNVCGSSAADIGKAGVFMGKWIFRMLAMVAIGGAVIFTAQFRGDGQSGKTGAVKSFGNGATGEGTMREKTESVREELVDLYFSALHDLIRSDFGLAQDVAIFGFDFSQAGSLTEKEGQVLASRLKEKFYKSKVIFGTFEELEKAGHIKNERQGGMGIHWSDGLLLTLKVTTEKEDCIIFSMSAWRSGDGAVGKDDCKAEKEGGKWNYDFNNAGSSWIS